MTSTIERTAQLDAPLPLRSGATLKNRLVKSAMSECMADLRGVPTPELMKLYERWAQGGVGALITGHVMVDRRSIGEPRNVIVEDERNIAALQRLAAAASVDGCAAIAQINHPGRQTPVGVSQRVVAPSAVPVSYRGVFPKPRALEHEEILELVERYAECARVLVKAGFAGVQLHGAHGYLISQFLSPRVNQRDDEWGGDAERRRRFLLEIQRAVRAAVGPDAIVAVKLNSADFQRGGFSEEESLEVIRLLDADGVDFLEVSGGTYEAPAMTGTTQPRESTVAREAYFLDFARRAREAVDMPLMVTGGFRGGEAMREAVVSGAVDLVGLARPLALDPDLPHRLLSDPAGTRSAYETKGVGIRRIDGAVDIWWTQHQLHRLGAGKEPDPGYAPWRAALAALREQQFDLLRRRRGH